MKMWLRTFGILLFLGVIFGCTPGAAAQTASALPDPAKQTSQQQYFISAKAGTVNFLHGNVTIKREGATTWAPVTDRDTIDTGNLIRVPEGGVIELLLNPGSYARVAGPSEFEMTDASITALRLKLMHGYAIFEVTGLSDGNDVALQVTTPKNKFLMVREGIYRLNVLDNGTSELIIRKGRARYGDGFVEQVKDKKRILVTGDTPVVTKVDSKDLDEFDRWSQKRGQALAEANNRLPQGMVASAFSWYQNSGAYGFGYAPFYGIWSWSPLLQSYVFCPFYDGWYSPYGYWYHQNFGLPWWYYRPLPQAIPTSTGGTVANNPTGIDKNPRHKFDPNPIGQKGGDTTVSNNSGKGFPREIDGRDRKAPKSFPTTIEQVRVIQESRAAAGFGNSYDGSAATSNSGGFSKSSPVSAPIGGSVQTRDMGGSPSVSNRGGGNNRGQ